MEASWFPGATLDRIDADLNYTPTNCRWVSKSENSAKKQNNVPESTLQAIWDAYKQGLSQTSIAKLHGLRQGHVCNILKRLRHDQKFS